MQEKHCHNPDSTGTQTYLPLTQFVDPYGCAEAIDHLVESMLCGKSRDRVLVLNGPMASGKRLLARSIAAEFGGPVGELEPMSVVRSSDVAEAFRSLGREGVLIIHNFDELPAPAQLDLWRAISFGRMPRRRHPFLTMVQDGAEDLEDAAPILLRCVILTTNHMNGMLPAAATSNQVFTLRRSREGIEAALMRRLIHAGTSCDENILARCVEVIYRSAPDVFEKVSTLLLAAGERSDRHHVDEEVGSKMLARMWGSMPTCDVCFLINGIMEQEQSDPAALPMIAECLGIPPIMLPELHAALSRTAERVPQLSAPEETGLARRRAVRGAN